MSSEPADRKELTFYYSHIFSLESGRYCTYKFEILKLIGESYFIVFVSLTFYDRLYWHNFKLQLTLITRTFLSR